MTTGTRLLQIYLVVTGVLAVVAVLAPSLVVLGLFLGILPGLILQTAPAAFLYGVVFALFRHVQPASFQPLLRNAAALCATLLVFWTLPQPALWRAESLLAGTLRQDITPPPDAPVPLSGHILVETPRQQGARCAALCAALLSTPGVTAVTLQSNSESKHRTSARTFQFVSTSAPGDPVTPTAFGFDGQVRTDWRGAGPRHALEAAWNLRLAKGLKLVASSAGAAMPPADFALELHEEPIQPDATSSRWSLLPDRGRLTVATIRDRERRILLRRQTAAIAAPAAPLLSVYTGGIESGHIGWRRRDFAYPQASTSLDLDALALAHTNVARGVDPEAAIGNARSELAAALADPSRQPGDPGLRLANPWMGSFRGSRPLVSMPAGDAALVERIALDPRIENAEGLSDALAAMAARDAQRIRRPAEARLLRDPKAARKWVAALRALPPGSFANPTPEERTILADPALSRYAAILIERQADRGAAAALPDLLRILEQHATADPGKHGYSYASEAIEAVRLALRELGPDAAPALPRIEELFARHDRLRRARNIEWDATLVAMGMPPERASKPATMSGSNERYARAVEARARRRQQQQQQRQQRQPQVQ